MEAGHTGIIFSTQAGTSPKTQARRRNSCDWLAGGRTIAVPAALQPSTGAKKAAFFRCRIDHSSDKRVAIRYQTASARVDKGSRTHTGARSKSWEGKASALSEPRYRRLQSVESECIVAAGLRPCFFFASNAPRD